MTTGCGRMEPVVSESEGAETTVAVEKKTEKPTDADNADPESPSTTAEPDVTTASTNASEKATTTATAVVVRGGGTTLTVPKRTNTAANTTTKRAGTVTTAVTTTTTAVTTTAVTPNHTVFTKDTLMCKVTRDGIDIFSDEDKLQTIEIDTEELLAALSDIKTELKAQLIIDDIDLDGHDDLFIPRQVGTLNTFGEYYHYDTEEEKFVKWEELREIDSCAEVNEEDRTFTTEVKLSEDEYEVKVFAWNEGEPVIQTMKKQYKSTDSKDDILIDYFEYTNGEEQLVKRERVLFDADGREVGAEEIELD